MSILLLQGSEKQKTIEANTLIVSVFLFYVSRVFTNYFPRDLFGNSIDSFVYTDWLIDYSGGFVRRGLSGEIVSALSVFASPKLVVGLLIWGIFAIFLFLFIRLIYRSIYKLNPILLTGVLFLPSMLPFYLNDHGAFGRKEFLGFVILLWHLYILERRQYIKASIYVSSLLPLSMVALPFHILVHEASFLQFVPVHLLISYSIISLNGSSRFCGKLFTLALIYFPVLITFLIVFLLARPNLNIAVAIYKHWESVGALSPGASDNIGKVPVFPLRDSISGLTLSFAQACSMTMSLSISDVVKWGLIFCILGFFTGYIGSMLTYTLLTEKYVYGLDLSVFSNPKSKKIFLKYFCLPLFLSSPLYILGWDFGRWFSITCVCYIVIALSKEIVHADLGHRSDLSTKPEQVSNANDLHTFSFRFYASLVGLLVVVFFIRLPSCCIDWSDMFGEPIPSLIAKAKELSHR